MKYYIISVIILLSISTNTFSQWIKQYSNLSGQVFFYSIVMADESNGFVVGANASDIGIIYKTTNGGEDFEYVLGSGSELYSVCSPTSNIAIGVGANGRIIKTTDTGSSWHGITSGTTRYLFSVFFMDANTGWAVGGSGNTNEVTILKTVDQGETWQAKPCSEIGLLQEIHFVNNQVGWAVGYQFEASQSDDRAIIVKTTDGGETWESLNCSVTDCRLETVFFLNENAGWVAGLRDYYGSPKVVLLKTTDGGDTWNSQISNKLGSILSLRMADANRGWAVGIGDLMGNQYGLNYETDDGGNTWIHRTEYNNITMNCIFFLNPTTGWGNSLASIYKYHTVSEDDLNFTPLSDMNDARYGFGYTFDGNNIYSVCGGLSEASWIKSTSIERYNLSNNTWTEFVTDLIPRRYCSAEYVPSQNKIYIFNGDTYTNTTYTDTVEIVNVQTGELSYSATNPYPVEYGGSAVWNNKIYLFGGSNSNGFSNRLYEFDPMTNNWTRLPDMPEAKQTNGEIVNGVLYVLGGYSGSSSKRIDAYNIQNSSWSYLGDMPVGISAQATAKSGKYIWTVGSYDNIKHLAVYNTETNNYTQLSSNMIGRRHSGAWVVGNNLYIFGGNQSGYESALNSMEYADISNIINAVDEHDDNQMMVNYIYPNPFSTSTTIEYELKQPEKVTLTIYDYLGKLIYQIDKNQIKGKQQLIWNADGLPDGIYYFRLQAGEQVANGKMVKVM